MDLSQFERRKVDHLALALDSAHQASSASELDRVVLTHDPLPDLNFEEVRLDVASLGKSGGRGLFVPGMTGGHPDAQAINERLAEMAESRGWAMGLGSQRRELIDAEAVLPSRALRRAFPRLELFGNLGIAQVIRLAPPQREALDRVLDALEPQGMFVHLNALQEALQPEGTPQFAGWRDGLARLSEDLAKRRIPLLLKETGCGMTSAAFNKLEGLNIAAVDVSGLGGTHWGRIEGGRAQPGSLHHVAAQTFAQWGVPTWRSVREGVASTFRGEIWASGGVRSGLDVARLWSLGATRVGLAQPALKAALNGRDALHAWAEQIEFECRVALFCTGSRTPDQLVGKMNLRSGEA